MDWCAIRKIRSVNTSTFKDGQWAVLCWHNPSNQGQLGPIGRYSMVHQVNGLCHAVPKFVLSLRRPTVRAHACCARLCPKLARQLFFLHVLTVLFQFHVSGVLCLSSRAWRAFSSPLAHSLITTATTTIIIFIKE